ncbi:unnamed protein product [Ilex paraguariensis]|uniref:Uncharacterized protein n=1 Tax=Ilex paraguariensis TaxID=185542 RepID=A0ABC8UF92_9AQUA
MYEDGWVVCRVFKKKNYNRADFQPEAAKEENLTHMKAGGSTFTPVELKQNSQALYDCTFDGSMHLPQLLSPESVVHPYFLSPIAVPLNLNSTADLDLDLESSQNLLRLTSSGNCIQQGRFTGDWSFLDRLLASHQVQDQGKCHPSSQVVDVGPGPSAQRFPFHYRGYETDILKFPKYN